MESIDRLQGLLIAFDINKTGYPNTYKVESENETKVVPVIACVSPMASKWEYITTTGYQRFILNVA